MLESSLVIYNECPSEIYNPIVTMSLGGPVTVEFNFDKIWEFKNKCEDFDPNQLRFYHVHPRGLLRYSSLDLNCIKGLNIAFGTSVYFAIITFENDDINDMSYQIVSYKYIDGQMVDVDHHTPLYPWAQLLKVLSYGDI